MSALPQIAARLSPLLGKLGSSHDGEVLSAARAIGRQLEKHGLTFNDIGAALQAEPVTRIVYRDREPEEEPVIDWLGMAEWCAEHLDRLSDREAEGRSLLLPISL